MVVMIIMNFQTGVAYSKHFVLDVSAIFEMWHPCCSISYIVEWNESEGAVKRTYNRLRKQSVGVVQFDTTKNRFLAAGDEFLVKFWDMDSVNLLTTTDVEGGLWYSSGVKQLYWFLKNLPASSCIRFNKEGILLAISTSENGIKVLANPDGIKLLRTMENRSFHASRVASVVKIRLIQAFQWQHMNFLIDIVRGGKCTNGAEMTEEASVEQQRMFAEACARMNGVATVPKQLVDPP